VSNSFDYGCGKLRYKEAILKTTDTLALVDSEIQLSRQQIIWGHKASVRNISRRSNRLAAYNTTQFGRHSTFYDRGFCINVLSVIPIAAARKRVLKIINGRLRPGGTCLFVVQYRNSDFTRMRKMRNAHPWLDGYLIDSLRGFSFYGMIQPPKLKFMLSQAGFEIVFCKLNEGSAYVLAKVATGLRTPILLNIDESKNFRFRDE
jgi:hypothetical protein